MANPYLKLEPATKDYRKDAQALMWKSLMETGHVPRNTMVNTPDTGEPANQGQNMGQDQYLSLFDDTPNASTTALTRKPMTPVTVKTPVIQGGVDISAFDYAPDSTMGRMGFRTQKEYQDAQMKGEGYGPWAGELVPEGSTVLLNEQGVPFIRTWRKETFGGQYHEVPQSDPANYYTPKETRAQDPLSYHSKQTVYKARLSDWLQSQLEKDATAVEEAEAKYNSNYENLKMLRANNELSDVEYNTNVKNLEEWYTAENGAFANLMTEDKAFQLADYAAAQLGAGGQVETLPFWNEIQGVMGEQTNALMNQANDIQGGISRDKYGNVSRNPAPSKPVWGGYQETPQPVNEQQEYQTFVEKMGLTSQEDYNYMAANYDRFYKTWESSGKQRGESFITWLMNYLR